MTSYSNGQRQLPEIFYYLGVCCRTPKLKLPLLADGGLTTSSLPPLVPLVTRNTWKNRNKNLMLSQKQIYNNSSAGNRGRTPNLRKKTEK